MHADILQLKSVSMITSYLEKNNEEEKDIFSSLWIKLLLVYRELDW